VTSPGGRRRWPGAAVVVVLAVGFGSALSACGGDQGTALARQACTHINRSMTLLNEAQKQPAADENGKLAQQAYNQLRMALPIAAEAANSDGQWQALMTTVSESNRVPEATLEPALVAQCGQADQSPFNQPPPSGSIPPPAPASSS
jgi:hypothetical protein